VITFGKSRKREWEVAMRKLVPVLVLITLGACAKHPDVAAEGPANSQQTQAAAEDVAKPPPDAKAGSTDQAAPAPALSIPQLAYVYDYAFALPANRIEQTLDYDQQACVVAGPTVCQLLGSGLTRSDRGLARGRLKLQATSAWIDHFRAGAADEAKAAGGRVDAAKLASEDLSRSLVDTEAALRAKTALRDRLQQLLAARRGKLSDVMDVEHELTQAQADLDATTSELPVMRGRVAMSKLMSTPIATYAKRRSTAPGGLCMRRPAAS
jgi:hypothetical protein